MAGTPLGDPIEVNALAQAVRPQRAQHALQQLAVGSVKSCYGHTEGAAGITGLLLAAATLGQQGLAPVMNLRNMNPYVSAGLEDWRKRGLGASVPKVHAPRVPAQTCGVLAATSSFGMSGTNAHLLVAAGGVGQREGTPQAWMRMRCVVGFVSPRCMQQHSRLGGMATGYLIILG
jgi:acyl transferase domain-containing protein